MSEQRSVVRPESLTDVPVGDLERALVELWPVPEAGADSEAPPGIRACTLNLLVVSGLAAGMEGVDALGTLVGDITAEHPARIFLIAVDSRQEAPALDAWVSARCTIPRPGEQQVCCEQITLVAKGRDIIRVPSLVRSLLVADIPTVLLWKTPVRTGDRLLAELLPLADRAVIDSSEEHDPLPTLAAWSALPSEQEHQTLLGDLAWTHVTPWRSLLAQAFQPPGARSRLGVISTLQIRYSTSDRPQHSGLSQGLLLTAWMAGALGWMHGGTMVRDEHDAFTCLMQRQQEGGSGTVEVKMSPAEAPPDTPGGIESVIVRASGFSVELVIAADRRTIALSTAEQGTPPQRTLWPIRYQDETELLAREMEVLTRDAQYEACLARLRSWFPPGGGR